MEDILRRKSGRETRNTIRRICRKRTQTEDTVEERKNRNCGMYFIKKKMERDGE